MHIWRATQSARKELQVSEATKDWVIFFDSASPEKSSSSIWTVLFRRAYELKLLCFWMPSERMKNFHSSPPKEKSGAM